MLTHFWTKILYIDHSGTDVRPWAKKFNENSLHHFCLEDIFLSFVSLRLFTSADYGRIMKPFFIEIHFWAFWLWQTNWADIFWSIWGILADKSAPILLQWCPVFLQFSKKPTKKIWWISALEFKKWLNQTIKGPIWCPYLVKRDYLICWCVYCLYHLIGLLFGF